MGVVLDLTTGTTIAEAPPLGTQIFVSAPVLTLLSFLLYVIASSRTHRPSRTVGLLLLLPFFHFSRPWYSSSGTTCLASNRPKGPYGHCSASPPWV